MSYYCDSSSPSSYSPYHVALVNMSANILLSCILPCVSGAYIPPCQHAKLSIMISLAMCAFLDPAVYILSDRKMYNFIWNTMFAHFDFCGTK